MADHDWIDQLPGGAWVAGSDLRLERVNRAMAGLLERPDSELRGELVWALAPEASRQEVRDFLDRVRGAPAGTLVPAADLPWCRADGAVRWMLTSARASGDRIVGTGVDVTLRRTREAMLAEREAYYRVLGDAAADQIFVISPDDRVAYVNRSAAEQFRTVPEQLIGRQRSEVFPPEIARQQARSLEQVFRTGQPLYIESPAKYLERSVWLGTWLAPVRDARGQVTAVLGYSRDMTARKRAEEALRSADDWLRAVLAHVPLVLWAVDASGAGTFWGGLGVDALGLEEPDVVGRALDALAGSPIAALASPMRRALAGEPSTVRLEVGNVQFDAWCAPLAGADGAAAAGALGVLVHVGARGP